MLPHGLHPNVASSEYHERALGVVSKTALDQVRRSPSHYKAWLDGAEEEPTPTLLFGAAFHCALLEPLVFGDTYAVQPDFGDCRFKEAKAERDRWRAANNGKTLVSPEDMLAIIGMSDSVRSHSLAGKMIRDGLPELTARWRDEETGLECKCRADYYVERHGMIVDVKSTSDASFEEFRRSVAKYGYHRQAALYSMGFEALKARAEHFVFIAVEKKPPYAVAIYSLDLEALSKGHTSIREDMATLAECVRTNKFPGYPPGIQTLSLPSWAA